MIAAPVRGGSLAGLAALLTEIGDAKRVHVAGATGSFAERRFMSAWAALAGGAPVRAVALEETAAALCAARLGGIDATVLDAAGASRAALLRAFDEVAGDVPQPLRGELRGAIGAPLLGGMPPGFARALARQPRAGATRPGHPRLMLSPAESHAEHCWVVAVGAVLATGREGAGIEAPFLCGLAHHLHNARLPDAGFAGEELLGDELAMVMAAFTARALAELPSDVAGEAIAARRLLADADTPEARAFHTADVLDRVIEMRHHARVAAFTLDQALDDLDLVHEGPLQVFGLRVVEEAGLR